MNRLRSYPPSPGSTVGLSQRPGVTFLLLCGRPLAHDEADDGENDEDDKQDIGDVGRGTSHSRDPQERRDQPMMRNIAAQCSMIDPPWIGLTDASCRASTGLSD